MISNDTQKIPSFVHQFFLDVRTSVLHPGTLYEGLGRQTGYGPALAFLFLCSVLFSLLASLFVPQKVMTFTAVFLLNAVSMAFITAFILYLMTAFLCKGVFTYQALFAVTAYANVTLLAGWIPGLSWLAGVWKLYLIGLGMVKVGRIGAGRAFIALLGTAAFLLLLICLAQPIFRQ